MGAANIKQLQSCAKSINMVLIVVSKRVAEIQITKEEARTEIKMRLNGVKRTHGFKNFVEMMPFIIQKAKATKSIPLTVERDKAVTKDYVKGDKVMVKVNIKLLPELLEEYCLSIPALKTVLPTLPKKSDSM